MNTTELFVSMHPEVDGTSLQGYMPHGTTYAEVCKVFGKPNATSDDYKVDAEWVGLINGKVFTIYNYKDGVNYNGRRNGTPKTRITDWHIGANEKETAGLVVEYFKQHCGTLVRR